MITNAIPHNAKYVPVSLIFTAQFNTPEIGRYSFDTTVNKGIELLKFQPNTWYFLDSMSIGGTISDEEYARSIYRLPSLTFKKSMTGERVYVRSITLPKYSENRELTVFVNSDKAVGGTPSTVATKSDTLIADLEGSLNQIPETVGQSFISLNLAISIFQIDEKYMNEAMRSKMSKTFANRINK